MANNDQYKIRIGGSEMDPMADTHTTELDQRKVSGERWVLHL